MSDLGAIFHVKKDGVQYDAHAYTTLDECPEPNLKLTYKGQQGYVKLEAKGDGDVPCYVKPKSGSTVYQVKKEAVPTGSIYFGEGNITFTVPSGIKVIKVVSPPADYMGYEVTPSYVGVTPNSVHKLYWNRLHGENFDEFRIKCKSHNKLWGENGDYGYRATLSWSPEINKKTPTIKDY